MQQGGWNQGAPPGTPPEGGFGAPPRAPPGGPAAGFGALSSYGAGAPPGHAAGAAPSAVVPTDGPATAGSFGLGFLAGFFGNIVGLALVMVIAQGHGTRRGALVGFIASIVVGLLTLLLIFGLIVRLLT